MTAAKDELIDWLLEGDPSIRWRCTETSSTARSDRTR